MKNSSFKCDCGKILEITPAMDIIKCYACGQPWLEKQWQQKLSPSIGELSIPDDSSVIENPEIIRQKPLPNTRILNDNQILAIKEASVKIDKQEMTRKKKCKRPLPATQMFSMDDVENIKKASLESQDEKGKKQE